MADYYPLIARAVAGLDKNTGDARRMVYERARDALVTQLRGTTPPLSESDITRERLALEEAIRKVEADTARRLRLEAQAKSAPASPRISEPIPQEPFRAPPPPSGKRERLPPLSGADPEPVPPPPTGKPGREPPPPPPPRPPISTRLDRPKKPLSDDGLKGFRDVVAETETLGRATAQASKSAREALAAVPTGEDVDRLEPRLETESLRAPAREPPLRSAERPTGRLRESAGPRSLDPAHRVLDRESQSADAFARSYEPPSRPLQPSPKLADEPEFAPPPRIQARKKPVDQDEEPHTRRGLAAAIVAVFFILALGAGVFWQRDRVALLFNAVKGNPVQTQREAVPTRPKIADRVGQPGATQDAPASPGGADALAPVAQRVVLYEEDPADPAGKRYVGSAVWRMDTVGQSSGQPELAVRADVEIPDRRITMTLTLRRNMDQSLPASHTIEIMFNLPADFPFGGISNVPGILMKQAESTRGSPLAGLAVKVTSGFFLVGLSAVEGDQQRNIQLLKERSWFDIPIVYNNGRRAILAVEKGNPGDRAFDMAFASWNPTR